MTLSQFYDLPEEEKDKKVYAFLEKYNNDNVYIVKITKYIGGKTRVLYDVMSNDNYGYIDNAIQREDSKNGVMIDGDKMVIVGSNWYYPDGKFGDTDTVTYEFKELNLERVWGET